MKRTSVRAADAVNISPFDSLPRTDALDGDADVLVGTDLRQQHARTCLLFPVVADRHGLEESEVRLGVRQGLEGSGFQANSSDFDGFHHHGVRGQHMAHPRAFRGVPDSVAVNERLPITLPDNDAGALDLDQPRRCEGVAVPGCVTGVRRCSRYDELEGLALSAPEHHEAPDASRSREPLSKGRVDSLPWLKHEMQRNGRAYDSRRAFRETGPGW